MNHDEIGIIFKAMGFESFTSLMGVSGFRRVFPDVSTVTVTPYDGISGHRNGIDWLLHVLPADNVTLPAHSVVLGGTELIYMTAMRVQSEKLISKLNDTCPPTMTTPRWLCSCGWFNEEEDATCQSEAEDCNVPRSVK